MTIKKDRYDELGSDLNDVESLEKEYQEYELLDNELARTWTTIQKIRDTNTILRRELRELRRQMAMMREAQLNREPFNRNPARIVPSLEPHEHSAASLHLLCSDWHIGKVIEGKNLNAINSFDQEIAERRVHELARAAVELANINSSGVRVEKFYIHCMGDIIQGYLRDTDLITCDLTPGKQVAKATELIIQLINYISNNLDIPIEVTVQAGNHGRLPMSRKTPNTQRVDLCMETMIGDNLQLKYGDSPDVNIVVPEGYYHLFNTMGHNVLLSHGDNVKGTGGRVAKSWSGIAPCLIKHFDELHRTLPWDVAAVGHFHRSSTFDGLYVNGCLCGPDEWSFSMGYRPSPAEQTLFMIDSKYGANNSWKIKLDHIQ